MPHSASPPRPAGTPVMCALRTAPVALATALLALWPGGAPAQAPAPPLQTTSVAIANFGVERATDAARAVADRAVASGDHQGLAFLIVDKKDARVYVFDDKGRLSGAAPALIGTAVGDGSVPGIGDRALSDIKPEERTTPSGRFFATLDRDLHGNEVLWVDYDGGVALHRMGTLSNKDRRSERLASPTPSDNRITYGCINVDARFYERVVIPAFRQAGGIVYVLPETDSGKPLFPATGSAHVGPHTASEPT